MIRNFGISIFAALLPALTFAAPVSVDGVLGAEWNGVPAAHVTYSAAAPINNFGTPGTKSNNVAYDVYLRRDASYLYVGLTTTGPAVDPTLVFSNLYFNVYNADFSFSSSIGFEVTNDRAFKPAIVPGPYTNDTGANLLQFATFTGSLADPDVIEFAVDLSVFSANALGVAGYGFPAGGTATYAALFESQSFGYSVAGDLVNPYLGALDISAQAVPEPGSLALVSLGLLGLVAIRKRKS